MSEDHSSDQTDGVLRATTDGPILRIVIDNPGRRNALTHDMIDDFVDVLTEASTNDSLRAISIRGAGDNFCAGADWVSTNAAGERPRVGDLVRRIPLTAHRIIELVSTIHLPVVCTVQGWATGLGCNIALAADFTVADSAAVFWEPFLTRGFTPDSGATWLLPRLVGLARAKQILLLGDKVTAPDAADWGLIHRTVDAADLDATADELLARLASAPTVAYGLAKAAIGFGQRATLTESMTRELADLELSCRAKDFKEGLAAFKQRRSPDFTGR